MSEFDLVVKGGQLVDGTGSTPRHADVGIRSGQVVAIGEVDGAGGTVIDAEGLVVIPGIIDIHTHFDAQVLWDPACTPSPLHGVTTAVSGNCGFSLAPIEESEIDYLVRMLAQVEGMPLASLYAGIDFSWKSFGEYLDCLDGAVGVNIGFLTGHSALRRVVMGGEAVGSEASARQLEAMGALLRDCLAAGALGFSSSQSVTHKDGNGNPVPSRFANHQELVTLAGIVGEYPGTLLEFIPGVLPFSDEMLDLMAEMALAANRSLNWNTLIAQSDTEDLVAQTLRAHERLWIRGAEVVPLTYPGFKAFYFNMGSGFSTTYGSLPGWAQLIGMSFEERMAVFADPAERRRLAVGAQSEEAGLLRKILSAWGKQTVVATYSSENRPYEGRTLDEVAIELGQDPFDVMLDIARRDELRTVFKSADHDNGGASWELQRRIWRQGKAVLGASDAGAHLDYIASFNYATKMLAACRQRELIPLEEAVHLLTDVPARFYGISGRGRIVEGSYADIVIVDAHTVGSGPVHWRQDLPGGAGRLYAEAEGIEHVLVNGVEIVRGKQLTGALPGTVLRSGRDTLTPLSSRR